MNEPIDKSQEPGSSNRVLITAAVATRNEEAHIRRCLESLLAQEEVRGELEILVIDGMSDDRTTQIVAGFPEYGTKIRLIPNPRRLQVYAWNAALREARGEYFAMIIAHADYGPRYFASCLEVLQRTGAAAVGGVQRPQGVGLLGRAIAWCMSSPFGIGNARFRYTKDEEESDSVFSIFTKSATLQALGGYDVRIPFDEDSELNYRLRRQGAALVVSSQIEVCYFVRRSLAALSRQMYRYGFWRRATLLKHPQQVPLRVYAPAALVAALLLSAALAALGPGPALVLIAGKLRLPVVVPALYAAFLAAAALVAVRKVGFGASLVPLVLATMHLSYGIGTWVAVFRLRRLPPQLAGA
jgi:succinoglycan biosynthesis protein ExoA